MASIPGRHDEVNNFVCKFLSLQGAGRKARLNLDCQDGQLWVSLNVQLGEQPGQGVQLLPNPKPGAVRTPRQTQPLPRRRRRKGGRPCREARRARRVLATFLALPFYCYEADEPPVDPTPANSIQHSAKVANPDSSSSCVVTMDAASPPPHLPATSFHVSSDEDAVAQHQACKERDARQSLALSEGETDASPADQTQHETEVLLSCDSPSSNGYNTDLDVISPRRESCSSDVDKSKETFDRECEQLFNFMKAGLATLCADIKAAAEDSTAQFAANCKIANLNDRA